MNRALTLLTALVLPLLAVAPASAAIHRDLDALDVAHAPQSLSTAGPGVQVLYAPMAGTFTFMVGGRFAEYVTESLYLGGAGFGGTTGSGGFGYGGALAGFEGRLGAQQAYELSLLVGGGGGNGQGGGFAAMPQIAYTRAFGGGVSGAVSLGYLFMPQVQNDSGVVVGLQLGFKSLAITVPVD